MKDLAFFDTSILLYSDDTADASKQARAVSLLAAHRGDNSSVISLQVLQEYYAAATRKLGVMRRWLKTKLKHCPAAE